MIGSQWRQVKSDFSIMSPRKRGRRRSDEPPPAIIQRIIEVSGWHTDTEICEHSGIDRTTLSKWLGHPIGDPRGIPAWWLKGIAYEMGCRLEWLMFGELPKYHDAPTLRSLPEMLQRLVEVMQEAPPAHQAIVLCCAQALASGEADVIETLSRTTTQQLELIATRHLIKRLAPDSLFDKPPEMRSDSHPDSE
jgi:hypothetical protein